MAQKFMYLFTTLFVALFAVSCSESLLEEMAPVAPNPERDTVTVKTPVFVDITVNGDTILLDEDGNPTGKHQDRVVISLTAMPDTAKVDANQPWALLEDETNPKTPAYEGLGGSTQWSYNHGNAVVEYSVYAELDNGRKLPLWQPERLKIQQDTLRTETDGSSYSIRDVRYSLLLGTQVLATADQVLCTEVGFVDEFLGVKILRQSHQFGSGVYVPATGILTCVDTLFYAERWKGGLKNEAFVLVHMQNHISVSTSGNIVVDLSKTVGQSWPGNSANLGGFVINETWTSKNIREDKLEAVVNGQTFNLKDSVQHVCRWNPDGGKVETSEKVRLDFAREGEPADRCNSYLDVNIEQNEVQEVKFLRTKHLFFPKEASVNTTNKTFSVDHKDRAWFELIYKNRTTAEDSINYDVNHLLSYVVVDYLPADIKGKTLDIDPSGNVKYNGKTIMTITLKSRTVKNLTYRGKDYTKEAAKCDLTPKTAFFGENAITVTLSHDSENVTGKIPATYNSVKTYKVKGNPVHVSWNSVTGTYQLTCNNKVIIVEVLQDDSEGKTSEKSYISYNSWTRSGQLGGEVTQAQWDAVLGIPVAINSNGKVVLLGSSMTLSHKMWADKVTEGTWSWQPTPCEAVAMYLTPLSTTQGRIDTYHEGQKVGELMVEMNFTIKQEPTIFPSTPLAGVKSDWYYTTTNFHYEFGGSAYLFLFQENGKYIVRYQKAGTSWTEVEVSEFLANKVLNEGKHLALVGTTGDEVGYIDKVVDKGSYCKTVYCKADGSDDKVLADTELTTHGNDGTFMRDPIRGIYKDGKIVDVDGGVLVVG